MTMTNMAISKIGTEPPWDMMGIDAHLEAFAKVRVRHPKINKAFERISGAIGPHSGTGICSGQVISDTTIGSHTAIFRS